MTLGRRLFKLPNNMGTLEVRSSSFSAFLAFWIIILRMVIAIGVLNRILNIPESSSNILNGHQLYLTTTALRLFPILYGRELCWLLVTICFMAAVIQASWIMVVEKLVGSTNHSSTVTLFGAAALARASQADADRTLELLLGYGVNHIDTAARYGDSELRIAPWMARHRKDFFLATKTGSRTAAEAREDIHRSLERLRVDHVDLIQLHSLGHPDDWERAMGPGGALEAAIEARDQGLARFIGVTGHGWTIAAMHRRSLARFDFDSVLLPYNFFMAQDERYRRSFEEVLSICRERNVAVQLIKSIARGPWAI